MIVLLNQLALMLSRWVYPWDQPSAFPFVVRRVVSNALTRVLLIVYRCRMALSRWGWL